jgi:hypothetical protein
MTNPTTCPVCGAEVDIDVVDVTFGGGHVTRVPGKWSCPNGCNPEAAVKLREST